MSDLQTVTGIILPNDWDLQGRLTEVVLYGADESEFVIHGGQEKQLLKLCHHRVSCTGTRAMDNRGRRVFEVRGYTVLGDEQDCGYDSGPDGFFGPGPGVPRMWSN
ncbi:hypothetical protein [Desulfocurvus sp. DL9XJH121]